MTRAEFIEELRQALQGNISQYQVNENLRYYDNYIIEESRKGRTEEQIIAELGNPRLIARTIIDTSEHVGNAYDESYYEESQKADEPQKGFHAQENASGGWDIRFGRWKLNSWYTALLGILIFIVVIVIVGHVMIALLPVILVLLGVWSVLSLLSGRKR